jgi:hypothetical protein
MARDVVAIAEMAEAREADGNNRETNRGLAVVVMRALVPIAALVAFQDGRTVSALDLDRDFDLASSAPDGLGL